MGLFDRKDDNQPETAEPDGPLESMANAFVGRIVDAGIKGPGPMASAHKVAAEALKKADGDVRKAVDEVVSDHVKLASAGGFVTGVGGLVTMPVSLPANVLGFYVLATRMVAAIAELRGYDVDAPGARAAISLSLVGADAEDILQKTGLSVAAGMTGSGRLARMAMDRMPKAAGMMVNKAVGFRLLTTVGGRVLGKLIRFVPIAGGVVGAGLDGVLMKRLADHARREFVQTSPGGTAISE